MTYDEALHLYFEGHPKADQPNEQWSRLVSGSWHLRNIRGPLASVGTVSRTVNYHCPGAPNNRYAPPHITLRERIIFMAWAKGCSEQSIAEAFSVSRYHVRVVLMEVNCKIDNAERAA